MGVIINVFGGALVSTNDPKRELESMMSALERVDVTTAIEI